MRASAIVCILAAATTVTGFVRTSVAQDTHDVGLPNPLGELHFASGSSELPSSDGALLDGVVRWLRDHPDRLLLIEGYADRSGNRAMNLRLSQQRTDTVRDELVRLGIEPDRLVRTAYGEMRATEDAAESRRVVLRASAGTYHELIGAQHRPRAPAPPSSPSHR